MGTDEDTGEGGGTVLWSTSGGMGLAGSYDGSRGYMYQEMKLTEIKKINTLYIGVF